MDKELFMTDESIEIMLSDYFYKGVYYDLTLSQDYSITNMAKESIEKNFRVVIPFRLARGENVQI